MLFKHVFCLSRRENDQFLGGRRHGCLELCRGSIHWHNSPAVRRERVQEWQQTSVVAREDYQRRHPSLVTACCNPASNSSSATTTTSISANPLVNSAGVDASPTTCISAV